MTEEQIKSLKNGDKFTIEYEVTSNNGLFIGVGIAYKGNRWTEKMGTLGLQLRTATLVTQPPTFEPGDTVRIVPDPLTGTVYGNGNSYAEWAEQDARILKEKLRAAEMQVALSSGHIIVVNIHCIELVKKAVKEKYIVRKIRDGWGVARIEEDNFKRSCAAFVEETHPNALAAAEAECARLNSEWRKQQEGGAE